jgi:Glutamine amidotransferases class-II
MIVAPTRRCTWTFRHHRFVTKTSSKATTITSSPLFLSGPSSSPWNHRHYHQLSSSVLCRSSTTARVMSTVPMFDPIVTDGQISAPSKRHISSSNAFKTDKILKWKSGGTATATKKKTLYDPSRETENCGVGLIASLKSLPSRDIVLKADEMLVRMAHRGGCGCDPASGDGSGMIVLLLFGSLHPCTPFVRRTLNCSVSISYSLPLSMLNTRYVVWYAGLVYACTSCIAF